MNKIYVVEGKHDYAKLKSIDPSIDVVITNGSEVSEETLKTIKSLSKNNKIVLLLDPDYPGERIRRKIMEIVPNADHVFVPKIDAISRNHKKIGIEHVDSNKLKSYINYNEKRANRNSEITLNDLYMLGLLGEFNSSDKRKNMCDNFNISYCNGKQFLKRLNLFGVTLEDLKMELKNGK